MAISPVAPTPTVVSHNDASAPPEIDAAPKAPSVASLTSPVDPEVLIVVARPEVATVSDLNDKQVVIAGLTSISTAQIKSAFAAAGASAAVLREGGKAEADSQLAGDTAAAIIAYVPLSVAKQLPGIPGMRLLRVTVDAPLNP